MMMMMTMIMMQVMSRCQDCEFRQNSFHFNGAAHGLRYTGRFIMTIIIIVLVIVDTMIITIMIIVIVVIMIMIITISPRRDKIELNHFEGQCWGKIQNDGASIQVTLNNSNQYHQYHFHGLITATSRYHRAPNTE